MTEVDWQRYQAQSAEREARRLAKPICDRTSVAASVPGPVSRGQTDAAEQDP